MNGLKQDARKQVIARLKYNPEILIDKISDDKTDSFFYEGTIAQVEKPNGTILFLIATGDIRINIKGKQYRNNQVSDAESDWDLTDNKIRELEESGDLEWIENNWFEIIFQRKGEDFIDSDTGVIVGTYDEGLVLLENYYNDEEY